MAEQSFLAKLGLRLGVLGSSASLALAAPLANGNYNPSCHTDAARTGMYFDRTAGAEAIGYMVGGQTGPVYTRSGSLVNVSISPNTDNTFTTGYGKIGYVPSGTTTQWYLAQASNYNTTDYALTQTSAGLTSLNGKGGVGARITIGGSAYLTCGSGSNVFSTSGYVYALSVTDATTTAQGGSALGTAGGLGVAKSAIIGATLVVSGTTDGTSGTTGSINTLGGIGVTKAAWIGTNVTWANGVASGTVTDAVTANVTNVLTLAHNSSGTAAASFGARILFNLADDTTANQNAAGISAQWSNAATATRTSFLNFQTVNSAAALTTQFTIGGASATFASTCPVTINNTTASTTSSTGALIVAGGFGLAGAMNGASTISANDVITGKAGFASGLVPAFTGNGTSTIAGAVTDGYTASNRFAPTYNGAFTVTRHNYMDLNNPAGTSTITDAAVMRFDAAPGTHKALAADAAVAVTFTALGPTGAQTTIQGWVKINVAGTLRYIPFW